MTDDNIEIDDLETPEEKPPREPRPADKRLLSCWPECEDFDISNWNDGGSPKKILEILSEKINQPLEGLFLLKNIDTEKRYKPQVVYVAKDDESILQDFEYPLYYIYATKLSDQYEIWFPLGGGMYCTVTQLKVKSESEDTPCRYTGRQYGYNCMNEFKMIRLVGKHPHINEFLGIHYQSHYLYIRHHYYEKNLHHFMHRAEYLDENTCKLMLHQIADAATYLMHRKVIHRNLSPDNILVVDDLNVKVSNFMDSLDMSNYDHDEVREGVMISGAGSVRYMPPELICAEKATYTMDVWSIGCLMIKLITGNCPYHETEDFRALFQIGKTRKVKYEPNHVTDNVKDLIAWCCHSDPFKRPYPDELMNSQYLTLEALVICTDMRYQRPEEYTWYTFRPTGGSTRDCKKKAAEKLNLEFEDINFHAKLPEGRSFFHRPNIKLHYWIAPKLKEMFSQKEIIGSSTNTSIRLFSKNNTNEEYAIKIYYDTTEAKWDKMSDLLCEIDKMKSLFDAYPHPNIAKLYGIFVDSDKNLCVQWEYFEKGSLLNIFEDWKGKIGDDQKKKYLKQILKALEHMAQFGVYVSSLKLENVMRTKEDDIKIMDYGELSRYAVDVFSDSPRRFRERRMDRFMDRMGPRGRMSRDDEMERMEMMEMMRHAGPIEREELMMMMMEDGSMDRREMEAMMCASPSQRREMMKMREKMGKKASKPRKAPYSRGYRYQADPKEKSCENREMRLFSIVLAELYMESPLDEGNQYSEYSYSSRKPKKVDYSKIPGVLQELAKKCFDLPLDSEEFPKIKQWLQIPMFQ